MATTLTLRAFTDSVRDCECCNKKNLKGTYLLTDEFNNEFYYGQDCAKKAMGINSSDFKKKSELSAILKNIVSEAFDMSGDLSLNIQTLIAKYKLRLPIYNAYFNKETQSSF